MLRLRADAGRAFRWSLVCIVILAASGWIILDSHGHPMAWFFLVASAVVTTPLLGQSLADDFVALDLTDSGIHGQILWRDVDLAWADVTSAAVRQRLGDSVLEVSLGTGQVLSLWLPIGCDVPGLHAFLAERFSESGAARADATP